MNLMSVVQTKTIIAVSIKSVFTFTLEGSFGVYAFSIVSAVVQITLAFVDVCRVK